MSRLKQTFLTAGQSLQRDPTPILWAFLLVIVVCAVPADVMAQANVPPKLKAFVDTIKSFNLWLITVGGALAVTGFIRVCLALLMGLGNAASAAVMLAGGLAVASAAEIVGFFI